ncbi:Sugar lactone lactonase YvrE [Nakamurella panacisegetis]|uniref:Sugar lactone lactonase YvrE n=1 Tax=Nakamurella panacisegetis TaxID=1090615 RepID=A0A1H0SQL7_9ACTN|nr:SMP-30/gluconolactonase/LRE family protein [Nakamurella panacisegetis]SDP43983.1 Sugar lactone lactonase YvrE [Nakamurella panacisegetis]
MPRATQLTAPDANHGEGPVFAAALGGLRWVDMLAGDILHLDSATGSVTRWSVGSVAAAFRPRVGGGVVIATEREFVLADVPDGPVRSLGEVFPGDAIRFNEGACDPAGNFLCGTMAYEQTPGAGTMYRLSPAGDAQTVFGDVTISNGLAWTADATRAFYVDTPTGRVDVFDSDTSGALAGRRPFVTIDPSVGSPDGLTVDAEGGIWVALWGGAAVHHYSAAGTLEDVIELPVPKVTACTLGGDRLDQLFITTSRDGENGENPSAGAVFTFDAGVRGLPPAPFGG